MCRIKPGTYMTTYKTQVQFTRSPTNPENIWCKQNVRNLKRFNDKNR